MEKEKRNKIAKIILLALLVAGGMFVLAALPGLPMIFAPFVKSKKYSTGQFKRSLKNLEEKGLIGISKEGNKTVVRLTKNGNVKALKFKLEDMKIKPQARWDSKWRLAIFDIPEKFKLGRDTFVAKLKDLGFIAVQKSVWVCPYPCEDEIDFVSELYEIRPFVRLVTAENIDRQIDLLQKFKLT